MHKIKFLVLPMLAVFFGATAVVDMRAQTTSVLVAGMKFPQKIIYAPMQRHFLVSEAGVPTVANSGRISIVTSGGDRFTLIDGLPSGPAPPGAEPSGPSALWVQGNRIYIAIGSGNSTLPGPAPGSEIPNPNPNSPLFSSVLELRIFPSSRPRSPRAEYVLTLAEHIRIANGETVQLGGVRGVPRAQIKLIANFPDFTPNFRPDVPNNVRPSNPFGLVLHGNIAYVADASQNNIRTVDLEDGTIGTLISYPPRPNPNFPMGPPFIDPVPDSLRLFGNKLLVTFLTGFPFPAGAADVRQFDLASGEDSRLIGGLSSAIDALPVDGGQFCSAIYTLEFSTNMLAGAPGRLQRFDSPAGPPVLISNSLLSPTSMARDPSTGHLLVTEIFPGRIVQVEVP